MTTTPIPPGHLDPWRYEKNLAAFTTILPEAAEAVKNASLQGYSFCHTRQGALNICHGTTFLHSNYDPMKEAEKWFSLLDLSQTQVLIVYGVGLGYYYDACKEWLQQDANRYLVFLEDDAAVLRCLLETVKGTSLLQDRQVQIHYFREMATASPMIDWICWYFIQQQIDVSALTHYSQHKGSVFAEVRRALLHEAVQKNAMVAEYLRHGTSFFHNFYANTLHLPSSYRGNALFGKFRDIPAVICGAGPSLNKNLSVLRTLQHKAVIFAGSSSVNALTNQGLTPHFGAGIDPNPPQLSRLLSNQAHEVPFFYRGRMFHPAFQVVHGPRLYITGTGGYPVADWFEERLGLQGINVDEGHNVITFLLEIARAMGCNPIILVGMDLAYTDMRSYAGGVVENANINKDEILNSRDMDSNAFLRPDIYGKPVYTLWKWISESQWIGDFARQNPSTHLVNATEGGIGFPHVENISLAEAGERYLQESHDIPGRIHAEIALARMDDVTHGKVAGLLTELHESLKRCLKGYERLLEEAKDIALPSVDQPLETLAAPLKKSARALQAECGYQYVLRIFDEVYGKVLQRQVHQIKHDRALSSALQRNQTRLELQSLRFRFVKDTAYSNIAILEHVLEEHRRQEETHGKIPM